MIFPRIDDYNTGFEGYPGDTALKATMSISGGISGTSQRIALTQEHLAFRLPVGMSLKDVYGKQITFTIYLPCGAPVVRTYTIGYGDFSVNSYQHCNRDVDLFISDLGKLCFPLRITQHGILPRTSSTGRSRSAQALPRSGDCRSAATLSQ